MSELIICGTGHRPNKLAPKDICYSKEVKLRLIELAKAYFNRTKPDKIVSGMALGWDTAIAHAAIELDIYLIAAIPCINQESRWSKEDRDDYDFLFSLSNSIHYVSTLPYSPQLMHKRNEYIVNNSNRVVALWDGSNGGTASCVKYAQTKGVQIDNLWKSWVKYGGYLNEQKKRFIEKV